MNDLSTITTTELLDEIGNRVDAFVFIAFQDRSKNSYALMTEFKGNSLEVIGLAEMLKTRVMDTFNGSKEVGGE